MIRISFIVGIIATASIATAAKITESDCMNEIVAEAIWQQEPLTRDIGWLTAQQLSGELLNFKVRGLGVIGKIHSEHPFMKTPSTNLILVHENDQFLAVGAFWDRVMWIVKNRLFEHVHGPGEVQSLYYSGDSLVQLLSKVDRNLEQKRLPILSDDTEAAFMVASGVVSSILFYFFGDQVTTMRFLGAAALGAIIPKCLFPSLRTAFHSNQSHLPKPFAECLSEKGNPSRPRDRVLFYATDDVDTGKYDILLLQDPSTGVKSLLVLIREPQAL